MENDKTYIIDVICNLELLLADFKQSHFYKNNEDFYLSLIAQIEKAINYTKLGIYNNRPILNSERHPFKGDRFVDEAFSLRGDDKYHEIYKKYREMVGYVYANNYFN